ncbi:hypothetical protein C2S53_013524 [Perilla frutescens var. hirtella]|uniref:Uncharacterized protein n=1 Tax=Perilla frutescens var. hirtella TaxID=608512 RepID=A0AAD4J3D7_PERFH|nr:hypothetical protein C2S53_013524 [Perilla frutescens var. hirtella]
MAEQQQEEGWPLGLQPLNVRVGGMVRNRDLNASLSFNTLLTASPVSSDDSSSDLDTQSTGSFFHDKSMTLGTLIGISSILELSRRSTRRVGGEPAVRNKKNYKRKTWLLSLCSRLSTDAVSMNNAPAPSLGHFLEAERRSAADNYIGVDDFCHHVLDPNSLFVGGHVAPPQHHPHPSTTTLSHHNAHAPLLLSCLCGNLAHSSSN